MTKFILWIALVTVGLAAGTLTVLHFTRAQVAIQRTVLPGKLSQPHAFLDNNCAACHTPANGVEAKNCIVCHANNERVLQRQPTAFHAQVGDCAACHLEHQGVVARITKMDHVALGRIGFKEFEQEARQNPDEAVRFQQIKDALARAGKTKTPISPQLHREEALLNCATCHQTKDRHLGLFGNDCAQCHGTSKWTIPEFRHPSPVSQSCNQCHQAPPSHYMMHFKMISMSIASQPNAQVIQCFLCHQTTAWNDIRGVGFYKHH